MTTFTCPHCNQPHPSGARFCPVTGESIAPPIVFCKKCGKESKAGINFCPYCGGKEFLLNDKLAVPVSKKKTSIPLIVMLAFTGVVVMGAVVFFFLTGLPEDILGQATGFLAPSSTTVDEIQDAEDLPLVQDTISDTTHSITLTPTATPTPEPSPSTTNTVSPTASPTIPPTPTPKPSPTVLPTSTEVGFLQNAKDNAELIYIPPGEFMMGSDPKNDPYYWGAEAPMHRVSLDGYWIYRTEVTNSMYMACVEEKACPRPAYNRSSTRSEYFGNPVYDDYPVIFVSYRDATAYCVWSGGRLPTEAEWEKAARGTDARLFPWGNEPPNGKRVNYCDWNCTASLRDSSQDDGYRETAPVGSFPDGASPYGVLDMSGNVWEWVFDWFQATYYQVSPELNPRGPASGTSRVVRGGSWYNPADGVRTVNRALQTPDKTLETVGFRCVVDNP
jgi:formylglycine-generating enzyme required for sulfatase activity